MSSADAPDLSPVFPDLDAAAAEFVAAGEAPAVAYGVVAGGALVRGGGAGAVRPGGPAPDERSVLRVASMTKSFTAAAVLILRERGLLQLDDPVRRHLPAFADVRLPTADSPDVTLRHLLTMGAGLPTDDPWADRQESMTGAEFDRFLRRGLSFTAAPGDEFAYSNLGYAVLGAVVAGITGGTYRQAVRDLLLEPLQLTSSGFSPEDIDPVRLVAGNRRADGGWAPEPYDRPGVFSAIGGLYSSVEDLARWVAGFTVAFPARDGREGGHPLPRAVRREMQQVHRGVPARSPEVATVYRPVGYGFGLFLEDEPELGTLVSHPGGYPGYGSHMRWHPVSGTGVIVLAAGGYAAATRLAVQMHRSVLALCPPRTVTPWPEAAAAQRRVEELLVAWDDTTADDLFAANIDLDEPRDERRRQLRAVADRAGFTAPSMLPATAPTPAALRWRCAGGRGEFTVEISLTPQRPPRVQALRVTEGPAG